MRGVGIWVLLRLPKRLRQRCCCPARAGSGVGELVCALEEWFVCAARVTWLLQLCGAESPRARGGYHEGAKGFAKEGCASPAFPGCFCQAVGLHDG